MTSRVGSGLIGVGLTVVGFGLWRGSAGMVCASFPFFFIPVFLAYISPLLPRGVTDKELGDIKARLDETERSLDAMRLKVGLKPDPRRGA